MKINRQRCLSLIIGVTISMVMIFTSCENPTGPAIIGGRLTITGASSLNDKWIIVSGGRQEENVFEVMLMGYQSVKDTAITGVTVKNGTAVVPLYDLSKVSANGAFAGFTGDGSYTIVLAVITSSSVTADLLESAIEKRYTGEVAFVDGNAQVSLTSFTQTPSLFGTVTVNGLAQVGQIFTADTVSLGGSGSVGYQWQRGYAATGSFTNVSGAADNFYILTPADQGMLSGWQ